MDNLHDAVAAVRRSDRDCAECGASFNPTRDWSTFCSDRCRNLFAGRVRARGAQLTPLVLAWNATRHAAAGTEEAAVCRYARREISAIARTFISEDADKGRGKAVDYVRGLMAAGTIYADRARQ